MKRILNNEMKLRVSVNSITFIKQFSGHLIELSEATHTHILAFTGLCQGSGRIQGNVLRWTALCDGVAAGVWHNCRLWSPRSKTTNTIRVGCSCHIPVRAIFEEWSIADIMRVTSPLISICIPRTIDYMSIFGYSDDFLRYLVTSISVALC